MSDNTNTPMNIGSLNEMEFSQIVTEIAAQRFISNINPTLNSSGEIRVDRPHNINNLSPWTTPIDNVIARPIAISVDVPIPPPPPPRSNYTRPNTTRSGGPRTPIDELSGSDLHNVYFDIYKTLKHEIEDSEYIIGDESLFTTNEGGPSADENNIVYDKEEELTTLIIDFKQKLRRTAHKLMELSINYKKTKDRYEKNIKLIRTFIQLVESDDDKSPTASETSDDSPMEDSLSTRLKELIDDYIIKNYDEDKLYNKAKEIEKTRDEFMKYQSVASLVKSIQRAPICSICLDQIVDTVLVGCGHTCCSKCCSPLYNCHVCRKRIVKKQKMFL